jgi:hypothetical protein
LGNRPAVADQTGNLITINSTLTDQTGQIITGNAIVSAQTGQIVGVTAASGQTVSAGGLPADRPGRDRQRDPERPRPAPSSNRPERRSRA